MNDSGWVLYPQVVPQASIRLFCFPYAGGNASIFRQWPAALAPEIEVCPIQLPGRGERMTEPPVAWLPHLIDALLPALADHLDKPFALFGHSMGAIIAFEMARRLAHQHGLAPERLLISARRAPHVPSTRPPIHALPTEQFLAALRHLDGTPEGVLQSSDYMRILLPLLRADFALTETYVYERGAPLDCAISAFGGTDDRLVRSRDLEAWRQQTRGAFCLRTVAGGHFFLHSQSAALLDAIRADLRP